MTSEEQHERLVRCFRNVFGDLPERAIPAASQERIAAWDSIAQVTLISLISEEFGIEIDFEDFESASSFAAMLELIRGKMADAKT
jgi:acyl carrier protein